MSLGCPSVARRRSRRRLRSGLCEPSIRPRTTSDLRTLDGSRPPFRSLRCAATDGHPRFPQAHANHSRIGRRQGPPSWLDRSPLRRRPLVMITGFDFAFAAVGVVDSILRCPSGARQSPGGEADGDCGTGCVSLRSDLGRRPAIEPSTAHVLRSAVSAARRLTGTRGFRRRTQITPESGGGRGRRRGLIGRRCGGDLW